MPVVKVKGGYKVRSYSTGRLLKRRYKTRRLRSLPVLYERTL